MNNVELVALLAMSAWAVYRQTRTTEVTGRGRFTMALIYAAIGIAVGGFAMPSGWIAWTLLAASLALSAVIGVWRGHLTRMWTDAQGRVWHRGTVATVSLFVALVAAKFGLGTIAYFAHINDGAGFGEVLVMIAIMIAVQAQIIHRRAMAISPVTGTARSEATPHQESQHV